MMASTEQRRVRFADITGLHRSDLPIAADIWLEGVFAAAWATRDAMKLAVHVVRYMNDPNPRSMTLREIECRLQLDREAVQQTLALMYAFGAVAAHSSDGQEIRVALNLTWPQRLAAAEASERWRALDALRRPQDGSRYQRRTRTWAPPPQLAASSIADDTLPPGVIGHGHVPGN